DAARALATAKAVADKDPSPEVRGGYATMKARQVIESGKWENLALSDGKVGDGGAPSYDGNAAYGFAAGMSAAKLGDMATAARAHTILKEMKAQAESGPNAYRAKPLAIMFNEVAALIHTARNGPSDRENAERILREATAIERTLDAPSGPAEPIKPS